MSGFGINDWMVAWTPAEPSPWARRREKAPGAIKIGPWPDTVGWSDSYAFTTGCCEIPRHKMNLDGKVAMIFIDFHTIVVRDGIDPAAAHCEFLKIDEYRRRISPDIEGADE